MYVRTSYIRSIVLSFRPFPGFLPITWRNSGVFEGLKSYQIRFFLVRISLFSSIASGLAYLSFLLLHISSSSSLFSAFLLVFGGNRGQRSSSWDKQLRLTAPFIPPVPPAIRRPLVFRPVIRPEALTVNPIPPMRRVLVGARIIMLAHLLAVHVRVKVLQTFRLRLRIQQLGLLPRLNETP